jgi:3-oxoacyl-(acyl-carrier-protein) synthase
MSRRVVVTGMGVVAPNATNVKSFEEALRGGKSGLRFIEKMAELKFGCHVAGVPQGVDALCEEYFDEEALMAMNSSHRMGCLAAVDAWADAGLVRPDPTDETVHWDTGAIIGTGVGGLDTACEKVGPLTDAGKVRRLGSTIVEQVMGSGVAARVGGLLALGNQVTANSSACSTGNEAIIMGAERIRSGKAERMLCGGVEGATEYIWAGFDSMRVLCRTHNDRPEEASRPMSASAAGFIPGSGGGLVMVESLESAQARGARIHAEILGVGANCGGHRTGGSMTAPNPESVQRCIRLALDDAGITGDEIDAINGHLTATGADKSEVNNWSKGLGREKLPWICSTKSMIGHGLGAAGAIESVAAILMVSKGFVHPSINCEDVHPEIERFADSIPHKLVEMPEMRTIIKAGFGFGDVNSCLIFRKWEG